MGKSRKPKAYKAKKRYTRCVKKQCNMKNPNDMVTTENIKCMIKCRKDSYF
jgi:hypothetical protein